VHFAQLPPIILTGQTSIAHLGHGDRNDSANKSATSTAGVDCFPLTPKDPACALLPWRVWATEELAAPCM